MKHKYAETCKKGQECDDAGCWICRGGLAVCNVCGLYEGSLTTDCPGVQSYDDYSSLVYAGKIDFRNGKWVDGYTIHMAHIYGEKNV